VALMPRGRAPKPAPSTPEVSEPAADGKAGS
jgi:hypothetical protein